MSLTPKRLTATSIAVLPDGSVAQAVVDIAQRAYARWYSDGSWSPWWAVASSAADVPSLERAWSPRMSST